MHNISDKYLLQIHPQHGKAVLPVDDALTEKMVHLLSEAKGGTHYRGWHKCTGCGEMSGTCDLHVGKYITNSLAAHYLRWHRNDIPESEILKLSEI